MKKSWIVLIVIGGVFLLLYFLFAGKYNTMVSMDENVEGQWANVEVQYQRRSDLIPNLVNTVKGFAEQERGVLTDVVEARARATSVNVDASNLNEENVQQFQEAQSQLSGALSRLLVTVERYPNLKSNQNFLELQAQLEGTENRIAVARRRYNEAVREFNTYIRQFPNNTLAGMYGFERKPMFEADEGADQAPTVEF